MVSTGRELAEQRKCIRCGHRHMTVARHCDACGFDLECDLQRDFDIGWKHPNGWGGAPDAPHALASADGVVPQTTLKRTFLPVVHRPGEALRTTEEHGAVLHHTPSGRRLDHSLSLDADEGNPALLWAGVTLVVVVHLLTTWLLQA